MNELGSVAVENGARNIRENSLVAVEPDDGHNGNGQCFSSGTNNNHATRSLELRKLAVNNLLVPQESHTHDSSSLQILEEHTNDNNSRVSCFWRLFLRSNFSVRTQMMLTFGLVDALAILLILSVCSAVSVLSGSKVKSITYNSYDQLTRQIEGATARYLAESLSMKLIPEDLVNIIHGAAQERFTGYPNHPGYHEDDLVPFWDMESQRNKYPIIGEALPLDWQCKSNVNDENYMEHVQNRWSWYSQNISTRSAAYHMQGICDPSVVDPVFATYYPNCSEDNNNLETGGTAAPSPHNYQIHRKSSDLNPLFKALYEFHQEVYGLGLFFANGGSGASVHYPQLELNTSHTYSSIGCDWLTETAHPYNSSRSIVTDGEMHDSIQKGGSCRTNNVEVSARTYNPLERRWCRDQVVNPHKIHVTGPYLDAWTHGLLVITVGKAIYDKVTSEFIACIGVEFILDSIEQMLQDSRIASSSVHVSIVRNDINGTIIASTAWNLSTATTTTTIDAIDAGVSQSTYQTLASLVNYSDYANGDSIVWNATQVREVYEEFVYKDLEHENHVAGYPIPPPPHDYDPYYAPEFFAIVTVPTPEVNKEFNAVAAKADEKVHALVSLSIILCLTALGIIVTIIILVSHLLTSPLQYMNDVARDIINRPFPDHVDRNSQSRKNEKDGKDDNCNYLHHDSLKRNVCTSNIADDSKECQKSQNAYRYRQFKKSSVVPKTEIIEVVRSFRKMVSRFSSCSMAKSMNVKVIELENTFCLREEFEGLYLSRYGLDGKNAAKEELKLSFPYDFGYSACPESRDFFLSGKNWRAENTFNGTQPVGPNDDANDGGKQSKNILCSSQFSIWIVTLMVLPFLAASLTVSGVLIFKVSSTFTQILITAGGNFVDMEKTALGIYVSLRAQLTSAIVERPVRDLHVVTRFAGWLLFDGIRRTDSFTRVLSPAQLIQQKDRCSCDWAKAMRACPRDSQDLLFASQSQDNWANGDRNSSSFPDVAYSPETVEWWENVTSLPGSQLGSLASGYNTTYSRVRVLSALPVLQNLYSKDFGTGNRMNMNSFISFEADGTMIGFGCRPPDGALNFVVSKKLSDMRPKICPVGKYSYDPRCREWYNTGKFLYDKNKTHLYMTSPYAFSSRNMFAQSCTSPLVEPASGEYIGQTIVDFLSTPLLDYFSVTNTPLQVGGFPILVTATNDIFVNDTVIGPGFNLNNPRPIADVVFGNDPMCNDTKTCESRKTFQVFVEKMKKGDSGTAEFTRTAINSSEENIFMAHAPVTLKSFNGLNSSDFSRGVNVSEYLIYSLALAETEEGLLGPFRRVKNDLNRQVAIALIILISIIGLASIWVTYISYRIALSITENTLCLLDLIKQINRMDSYVDTHYLYRNRCGYSLEFANIHKTMESLYKIICSTNAAFFCGDLDRAYAVLKDVLGLYRDLNNKKGIGIACNNMGNMMLVMYRTINSIGQDSICGLNKAQLIRTGLRHYHEAIQSGETAYDAFYSSQGWSPVCLEFMQHLSNRYFNRALFLLTVKNNHENPKEIEELGLRDLRIARDMDREIVDEDTEAGWGIRSMDKAFDVLLSRLRGHLLLLEMGYSDDWEVDELLEEAFKLVKGELKLKENSALFQNVKPVLRIQQIEAELMRYKVLKSEVVTAAKIAIRMLFEDKYILPDAQLKAIEVLVAYLDSTDVQNEKSHCTQARLKGELLEYQKHQTILYEENLKLVCCGRKENDGNQLHSDLYNTSFKECNRGDFVMEIF